MQIVINSAIFLHVLFSVRFKHALIEQEWTDHLEEEFTIALLSQECELIACSCSSDHVHLLFEQTPFENTETLINQLKDISREWINEHKLTDVPFEWQDGYACFGAGRRDVEKLKAYFADQRTLHENLSYRDEFRQLLIEQQIEFEEEGLPHEPE
jgi:putative transposase